MKKGFILLAVSMAVLSATLLINHPTGAETAPRRIDVTAAKFAYTPSELTLKKGQPVILVLTSSDVAHGLKFSELNLNVKIDKGKTALLGFTPDMTGTFVGHCSVFCGSGHGGMTLILHVVE
jgi:cytochrome c oxidase subunit 2